MEVSTASPITRFSAVGHNFGQWGEKLIAPVRKRLGSKLLLALSMTAALSTGLVGASAWTTWNIRRSFDDTLNKDFTLKELSDQLVYYDEVLNMSAQMAAATGDPQWVERFNTFATRMSDTIAEIIELDPGHAENLTKMKQHSAELVAMEQQALNFVRQGQAIQAQSLLSHPQYVQKKESFDEDLATTLSDVKTILETDLNNYEKRLSQSMLLTDASLPILAFSWIFVLLLVHSYMDERIKSQETLEQQLQQIDEQERNTRRESEILQADVGELLDAVSALEEGNFSTEVPVNDRVTGLVADTLNRLTEELARVLAQVLSTAHQVSQQAQQLEEAAQLVASNANQQAQSVNQVLSLTDQVQSSANTSAQQIQSSVESLSTVRTTVEQGQVAIASLTQGINVLQEGTRQMVQQMKALGEFVGLTDQFVQEQRQIASLTQVLAMNASLVAARASEQRDPNQFVVVAREFEALATQVGNLAQRTNDGLITLEQRSTQIHKVVSTVNVNVQNLDNLVGDFTQGVEQSNQVFHNVRSVTGEAVEAGAEIAQSSQQIVLAAQSTNQVTQEIAELATRTAQLSRQTNQQTSQIEAFSQQLLENIRFFRLPDSMLSGLSEQPDSSNPTVKILQIDSQEVKTA